MVSGIAILDDWSTWGVFFALSAVGLLLLLARTPAGAGLRTRAQHFVRRISWRSDPDWLDWRPLLAIAAIWFTSFAVWHFATGQYGCLSNGLISDPLGELDSGRAFWSGQNPFQVAYCGSTLTVPYGLAAVFLDALGALAGIPGILLVWGFVALSLFPLVWRMAGPDRAYVTAFVATSTLYVPLITSEFSGATNAIVPVTLLLTLYLARRRGLVAAAIGGFLSTARFPGLFPLLGATGAWARRRHLAFVVAGGAFLAATGMCYAIWGSSFLESVFFNQFARRDYSLNFYGILIAQNALPASAWIEGAQAAVTLALVFGVFFRIRSPIRAVAITMAGVALVTPFLAYNFLVWLLPAALAGARARWWLWGIAGVGYVNFALGYGTGAASGLLPSSEALDLLLTALLVAMLVDLWREDRAGVRDPTLGPPPDPARASGESSDARTTRTNAPAPGPKASSPRGPATGPSAGGSVPVGTPE